MSLRRGCIDDEIVPPRDRPSICSLAARRVREGFVLLEEPLAGRAIGGQIVSIICRSGHGAVAVCSSSHAPVNGALRCEMRKAREASAHVPGVVSKTSYDVAPG